APRSKRRPRAERAAVAIESRSVDWVTSEKSVGSGTRVPRPGGRGVAGRAADVGGTAGGGAGAGGFARGGGLGAAAGGLASALSGGGAGCGNVGGGCGI